MDYYICCSEFSLSEFIVPILHNPVEPTISDSIDTAIIKPVFYYLRFGN